MLTAPKPRGVSSDEFVDRRFSKSAVSPAPREPRENQAFRILPAQRHAARAVAPSPGRHPRQSPLRPVLAPDTGSQPHTVCASGMD